MSNLIVSEMKNDSGRYIKLLGLLLISFISVLALLAGLFLLLRLIFGFVNELSWMIYMYVSLVLFIPAVLFITVFTIFLRRTGKHRSQVIRIISYILCAAVIIFWLVMFVTDMKTFIGTSQIDLAKYRSWDTLTLASSVAILFILGILQALTTEKETDWMERRSADDK